LNAPAPAAHSSSRVRVLIVDDSAVVRGLTKVWLEGAPDIEIVGIAIDGEDGIKRAAESQPDVVILDIEMPKLDGISALPKIREVAPKAKVLMASTLTKRNADITLRAMALGAADYIPKPETKGLGGSTDYRRELVEKVRAIGGKTRAAAVQRASGAGAKLTLTPLSKTKPVVLAIGSSTGGPEALRVVIRSVGGKINAPILITQHMPPMFTSILAGHLSTSSPFPAVEGEDGMPVRPGHIYIAPGDYHMTVRKRSGSVVLGLDQRPPENYCRPAVDPMFRSVAEVYGPATLAVVLTGMGHDGREGGRAIVKAGGSMIAQDEKTSVVWGMPGAVAEAGIACAVEPLEKVGPAVVDIFNGKRR
jgi:two-component system chemotaxis response regulator CheB